MPDNEQSDIYDLIGALRQRTQRSYEAARKQMATYLNVHHYERSVFYNKFRRKGRQSNYHLDEVLAIIRAYYEGLSPASRCTAYEAIQIFVLTRMRIDDHQHLQSLFGAEDYQAAWSRYLHEHGLASPSGDAASAPTAAPDKATTGHVFLSYSDHDTLTARRVRRLIEASGYRVWQDVTAIRGGREWIREIERGINGSCALVVITSAHITTSYWVWEEILHAQRRSKTIIPLVIDTIPLPFGMQQVHSIDAHADFAVGIQQLVDTLEPCVHAGDDLTTLSYRQPEIDYLDHVLLECGAWKTAYTPMSGWARRQATPGNTAEIRTMNLPWQITADFDLYIEERFASPQTLIYADDILRALDDLRQFVLLGEPGGGKTTTLVHIGARLAEAAKDDATQPLPILIRAGELDEHQSVRAQIESQLGALAYDKLVKSARIALLIDGLNEVPARARAAVLAEIRSLVKTAEAQRFILVITCRTVDYTPDLELDIAGQVVIQPLDPLRIRQIIDNYIEEPVAKRDELFWALAGDEARRTWERFVEEIGDRPDWFWLHERLPDGRTWGYGDEPTQFYYWNQWLAQRRQPERLLALAQNPFMLYMLMRVFVRQNQLPANRSKLLGMFVDFLLTRREGLTATQAADLMGKAAALAYAMQLSSNSGLVAVEEAQQHLGDKAAFYALQSASILEAADQSVKFTHQLLQEYFAAQQLDDRVRAGTPAAQYWPPESWWHQNAWDESAILLAGWHETDTTPIITWMQDANSEVAARCVVESGGSAPAALTDTLATRWVNRLGGKPIAARAAVGRALGILGRDPRAGVGLTAAGLPDMDWVEIPAGKFVYGDDEQDVLDTFVISRYPITYRQFQAFIEADDGFYNAVWWQGLARHEQSPGVQGFPYANHPRERVNWYDAVAFCRWLSHHLGFRVSLPTEYQWEKAARGPEGYRYPYGNDFNPEWGNIDQTELGRTSAVGLFPEGASPYGLLDMSGNVFEWCLNTAASPDDVNTTGPDRRSLRGGSWAHSLRHARADYRYANRPELRRNRVGFRVVGLP